MADKIYCNVYYLITMQDNPIKIMYKLILIAFILDLFSTEQ